MKRTAKRVIESRSWVADTVQRPKTASAEAEGGCGVVGLASSVPIVGRHILSPLAQMHNRGNGKGGGIAVVGLSPEQMGVPKEILDDDYLLQVAYLKPIARRPLEDEMIRPFFEIHEEYEVETSTDEALLARLEVRPPAVRRYFCRVREDALEAFVKENGLEDLDRAKAEDEFVFQNSFRINHRYYASGDMQAFVMSHGRNMFVLKIVGYAEDVIAYYRLEELRAHIWIGHQRYPTKGRVWHPGGAHPFVGLDEALVHNGDFANYHSVTEYLAQRNIVPLFLTDTEISVLLFDLLSRTYEYPLECIIEALAPTTERDFELLPEYRRRKYRAIQAVHMHGSPDGPWFFIIGKNAVRERRLQLMGITDTSMLRPQVFALVDGDVQIGIVASEKQAVDSVLGSISEEMPSVPRYADKYWNARGGSHNYGGAFVFSLFSEEDGRGPMRLICTNKFGEAVSTPYRGWDRGEDARLARPGSGAAGDAAFVADIAHRKNAESSFRSFASSLASRPGDDISALFSRVVSYASESDSHRVEMVQLLTLMIDRVYPTGRLRPARITGLATEALEAVLRSSPRVEACKRSAHQLVDIANREALRAPDSPYDSLVVDCRDFPMEGEGGVSFVISKAKALGWNHVIAFATNGHRFIGCGLGPRSNGFRIDVHGSPGDYLASGVDGAEVRVHGNGQDQLGQIFSDGRLVVYGDVGQTFLYGGKGGEAFVMGSAAGRPLINAVGRPKVVINGTCLDYLAESFMAGNPLYGGGFAIVNGIAFDGTGRLVELPEAYPGGNLFSLASGGAIYIRDPRGQVGEDQLNGGRISRLTEADWNLMLPYLQENERLFGISLNDFLLKVDGVRRPPEEIYRKIEAVPLITLSGKTQMQDLGE
ncbi:MAG: glutamate synthase [Methanobacteriota archaeon]|nr:MAG: glutamate synthase [Euryarchaeota archaeon]